MQGESSQYTKTKGVIDWVNCYIELNGMHRFKRDVRWGKLLLRMWNGELTMEDVEFIYTKVVTVDKSRHLPKDLRYTTYFNRDRDVINTVLFEERCTRLRCYNVSTRDTLLYWLINLKQKHPMVPMNHFIIGKSSGKIVEKMISNFQKNVTEEWIDC